MEKIKRAIESLKTEKARKIIGWLFIIYALSAFFVFMHFNILFFLISEKWGNLGLFFAFIKSYPICIFYFILILFCVFLFWFGILCMRKNFNKNMAVVVSALLIILFVQGQFLRKHVVNAISQLKFVSAVYNNDTSNAIKVIKNGFNLNDSIGFTKTVAHPLGLAIFFNRYDITKILIENGADVNAIEPPTGWSMLAISATRSHDINIIKLLLESGADINVRDKDGRTPLLYAAKNSNLEVLKYLMGKGAYITAKDNKGRTVLYYLKENDKISKADRTELEKLLTSKVQK